MENQVAKLLSKSHWTEEERQWLLDYIENSDADELRALMQKQFHDDNSSPGKNSSPLSEKLLKEIHKKIGVEEEIDTKVTLRLWSQRIAVAASFIGLLFLGTYIWLKSDNNNQIAKSEIKSGKYKNDIPQGRNTALLTLSNGTKIVLDNAKNGSIAVEGNTKVLKFDGKVSYSQKSGEQEVVYNSIATPRGGQYEIELPDGTRVWLNSATSIRFPTAFTGKERKVEISGEAYFEVAKNKEKPFIVKVNSSEIQVLGTHFNVMSYSDEASLKTTLFEGSVKFINKGDTKILKPGQQSQLLANGKINLLNNVDLDEVLAWKNGYFIFENASIETVMRQLSRWYDVDVVYNRKVDDLFYAEIPKNTNLSDVLKALELTGKVRFEIEKKQIVVMR